MELVVLSPSLKRHDEHERKAITIKRKIRLKTWVEGHQANLNILKFCLKDKLPEKFYFPQSVFLRDHTNLLELVLRSHKIASRTLKRPRTTVLPLYINFLFFRSSLEGWLFGTSCMTGCSGFFPAAHIERAPDTDTWTLHKYG